MKARYLFLVASVIFLSAAVLQWVQLHHIRPATLFGVAALIFLYLGTTRSKS